MVKVTYSYVVGQWEKAMAGRQDEMARAATLAMKDAVEEAKQDGRASIRASGVGLAKWANALRAQAYPKTGTSIGAAGLVWLRSAYGGIFERGGTITGSPFLWLPLPDTPKFFRGKHIRPGVIPGLVTIRRPGKLPLLGVRVRSTSTRAAKKVSMSQILRGTSGKRGTIRTIPLFFAIKAVTIKKRWHLADACNEATRRLPVLYAKHLRAG